MMTLPAAALLLSVLSTAQPDLPRITVTGDGFEVGESCVLVLPDQPIADADGDGVIHVTADDIVIRFAEGSVLRGAAPEASPAGMTGIGIRVDGRTGVTIAGADVRGFKVGLYATAAHNLTLEESSFSENFRQELLSTPAAEAGSDWLWPHRNDGNEWLTNYGAAVYLEESDNAIVRQVQVRTGQNGIVLDRVEDSKVYDCDASFLSGWGLAMWRSSRNVISRNALDFCVRGYSHGVYNRGQDSAGILMFEKCNDNVIAENSATHGGDGFFGFGGSASLKGENRTGNNGNLLIGNDFSYAPAHGIEMTFSFDNKFVRNRLVENAICGVWGGYSQSTTIAENEFAGNGEMAYGLERGGVNIEHGYDNRIVRNVFRENRCGIHLWWDADEHLMREPWAKANERGSAEYLIAGNRFEGDDLALHLRETTGVFFVDNQLAGVETEMDVDETSEVITEGAAPAMIEVWDYPVYGETSPVGARSHLAGRANIIMTQWGPWDHESPLLRLREVSEDGKVHIWEALRVGPRVNLRMALTQGLRYEHIKGDENHEIRIHAEHLGGVLPYRIEIITGNHNLSADGLVSRIPWQVWTFPTSADPRDDAAAWKSDSEAARRGKPAMLWNLDLPYGMGGPAGIEALRAGESMAGVVDGFGTVAEAGVVLPAGRWRVSTLSDDGVRVSVDGRPILENWTWHAPARDAAEFTVEQERSVLIYVEHFELDGYAVLEVELTPVDE